MNQASWVRYLLVGLLSLIALAGLVSLLINMGLVRWPLKVTTGPSLAGGPTFLSTIAQVLAEEHPLVQFRRIKTESLAASARALENGDSDLAVVRSDIAMPRNGLTIAILRRDNLVLIVPAHSRIHSFQGLAGKNIALLKDALKEQDDSLEHLLAAVLEFYSIPTQQVGRKFLSLDEIGQAVARKEVAGVLVLGPQGPGAIAKAMLAIAHATRGSPELVGDRNAEAIAHSIPGAEADDIEVGVFGGASPKPEEALPTLAVTFRLVGRHSLPDYAVGELARMLSLAKARLISTSPLAMHIEAPDSEDGTGLPIHPGAAAFFNGEQGSLIDSATSVFYLGSIVLGLFGSGLMWLFGVLRRRNAGQNDIDRLIAIMQQGRGAGLADPGALDALEAEIDELVARLLGQGRGKILDAEQLSILSIVVHQARLVLDKRRNALSAERR